MRGPLVSAGLILGGLVVTLNDWFVGHVIVGIVAMILGVIWTAIAIGALVLMAVLKDEIAAKNTINNLSRYGGKR